MRRRPGTPAPPSSEKRRQDGQRDLLAADAGLPHRTRARRAALGAGTGSHQRPGLGQQAVVEPIERLGHADAAGVVVVNEDAWFVAIAVAVTIFISSTG